MFLFKIPQHSQRTDASDHYCTVFTLTRLQRRKRETYELRHVDGLHMFLKKTNKSVRDQDYYLFRPLSADAHP
jgi:surfactin synthase thioesterase subunit